MFYSQSSESVVVMFWEFGLILSFCRVHANWYPLMTMNLCIMNIILVNILTLLKLDKQIFKILCTAKPGNSIKAFGFCHSVCFQQAKKLCSGSCRETIG